MFHKLPTGQVKLQQIPVFIPRHKKILVFIHVQSVGPVSVPGEEHRVQVRILQVFLDNHFGAVSDVHAQQSVFVFQNGKVGVGVAVIFEL